MASTAGGEPGEAEEIDRELGPDNQSTGAKRERALAFGGRDLARRRA
jgi:hypothetical protein